MTDTTTATRPSAAEKKAHKVWWPIDKPQPYDKNPKRHPAKQIAAIRASLRETGFGRPLIIGSDRKLLVGHGTLQAAKLEGYSHVPVVVRDDLNEVKQRALALADNRTAELGKWDAELLGAELKALDDLGFEHLDAIGFTQQEFDELIAGLDESDAGDDAKGDADALPASPIHAVTQRGDVWQLGAHRVLCGDCTQPGQIEPFLKGKKIDLVLTDPPYCSGGFQEAQRGTGSIGVRSKTKARTIRPAIENDKLSTRGYVALMKSALGLVKAPMIYAFTDWRMWLNLYDVVESSGYSVKNMLVWDKTTAGMGRGWRAQHELVCFAARQTIDFDPKNSRGNVMKARRTGNLLHPTQKPVDLIEQLLEVTAMATVIYDPMSGSGTTLMACELKGRTALCVELSPAFVDVIVRRWQDHTKHEAKLEGDGRTFAAIEKAREPAKADA